MMLQAAVRGARDQARLNRTRPPRVLAITVLTSMAEGTGRGMREKVLALAASAVRAGCDGVVASAAEAPFLRKRFGDKLAIVCPGIRPAQANADDQNRVATPAAALARGADWLVIGRPITASRDPVEAARRILNEMEAGTAC